MDGGSVDLQLTDDPYDSKLLEVGSAPLLVTTLDNQNNYYHSSKYSQLSYFKQTQQAAQVVFNLDKINLRN